MSATYQDDPLAGGPPQRRLWVKIAFSLGSVLAIALILYGMSYVVHLLHKAPPVHPMKPQADTGEFHYPPEAQSAAAARPGNTQQTSASSPVAPLPAGRAAAATPRSAQEVTPFNSEILAFGGAGSVVKTAAGSPGDPGNADSTDDPLSASLRATKLDGTNVQELPDPTYTIEQGRILKCKQISTFSSQHPGGITALIDEDVRNDTGTVPLLDKGARLFGVSQRAMVNGTDTAFVLWQNITTIPLYDRHGIPHKYRVTVNSAATTADGETGLPGDVDHHLWSKIPALIGVSLLQSLPSVASAAVGAGGNGGNSYNVIQNGSQGVQSAADSWLNRILSEPDTLRRLRAMPCGVLLMRDLNLRGAYQLRLVSTAGR